MNDVAQLILEAWQKLGPRIMADSDELARRLARRRRPVMTRPPRAWCLALRASDRRITAAHWILTPEHAMDLNHPEHPYEPIEHTVTIQPHGLRKFCRPVRTDSWGEEVADVVRQLGVSKPQLLAARWAGLFTERYVKGLGGKHGKPIPLIHSWTTLDPSGKQFSRPDPLWGSLWEFLPDMIPEDFEQTILRRPRLGWMNAKDDPGRQYGEGRRFIGWRWVCPACKREVSKIYYPLPPNTLFDFLGYDPGRGNKIGRRACAAPKGFLRYDIDAVEPPPPTFACYTCHRVGGFTRTNSGGWNLIVSHLTRGLLYGHEVEKPQWYRTQRKRARSRIIHGRPAIKRQAICNRMKNGWTIDQIARDMLITRVAVYNAIGSIFRQEGVKNRHELAAKLGWKHDQPLNNMEKLVVQGNKREEVVLPLILQNWTYHQISHKTGMALPLVRDTASRIYRKHAIPKGHGKRGLAEKLTIELTSSAPSSRTRPHHPSHLPRMESNCLQ